MTGQARGDGWDEPEFLRLLLRLLARMCVTACCQNDRGVPMRHEVAGEIEYAMRCLLARYRRLTEGPEVSGQGADPAQPREPGDEGPLAA